MGLRLERGQPPLWQLMLLPLLAVALAFALAGGLVRLAEARPADAFYYFLVYPLTSRSAFLEVLVKATPLLLTGLSAALAFAAGYWNIGGEGQLYAGAVLAAWLGPKLAGVPAAVAVPAMGLVGALGGAAWALGPAWLKVRLQVDEVVTTLLLNPVMLFIVSALLNGPWRNPTSLWPQSAEIAASAQWPRLVAGSRLHLGFLLAVLVLLCTAWLMARTAFGLQSRALGLSREAARFLGVPVARVTLQVALLSGALAGLAGAGEVAGLHYHLIEAISPGYGYAGVVVATLGQLHPLGVGAAAVFLAMIETGATTMSRALGVPAYLGDVVLATLLLTVPATLLLRSYRLRWLR